MFSVRQQRGMPCLFILVLAVAGGASAITIGFEPPDYTNGNPPIAPWVIQSNTTAVISDQSPIAGTQSLRVSGSSSSGSYYPINLTPTGKVTISGQIRVPYGNPDVNFGVFGSFRVHNGWRWEAYVEFWQNAQYREIKDRDGYVIGFFTEGGTYNISYTWDWTADTLTLKVDGPGASIVKLYPQTDRRNLIRILCGGSASYYNGTAAFDSIVWKVSSAVPGDLNNSGKVDLDDLIILSGQWLQSGDLSADVYPESGDQQVNLADFAVLAAQWLNP
ncbi:MAG: hypothetical protein GX455_15280 [Phycisphaerae bacterium]|nr:hypothetical protein [Phycisphaerae bacterium]